MCTIEIERACPLCDTCVFNSQFYYMFNLRLKYEKKMCTI